MSFEAPTPVPAKMDLPDEWWEWMIFVPSVPFIPAVIAVFLYGLWYIRKGDKFIDRSDKD